MMIHPSRAHVGRHGLRLNEAAAAHPVRGDLKNNISALELTRQLGVCYRAAWLVKHKLMQAMARRERGRLLGEVVGIDPFLGGERTGGKRGRGSQSKIPLVAAVETHDGRPMYVRFGVIADWKLATLGAWAEQALALRPRAQRRAVRLRRRARSRLS